MHKISPQLFFVLTLALACEREPSPVKQPEAVASSTPSHALDSAAPVAQPITDTTPPSSALTCMPKTFGPNDTLTLRMKTPHGDYLTANHPDGTIFFIVYPQFGEPSRKFSLVPSERFKTTSTLQLPATLRANPRVYMRDSTVETLFSQPGKYILWVGENLESDFNPRSVSCSVTFVAR